MSDTLLAVPANKHFSADLPDEPVIDVGAGKDITLKYKKLVEFDHDLATQIIDMAEFPGDRPLKDSHVIFLTRQMDAGLFRWEQTSIMTCKCKGIEYRINGQHTAWARLNMPEKGYRAPVMLLKYEAENEQAMRQLYATTDRGAPRTPGDVIVAYLDCLPEFKHYTRNLLRLLASGLAMWKWEDDTARKLHKADDRAFLMQNELFVLTQRVGNFLNSLKRSDLKHLKRASVAAVMYGTFEKAPEMAEQFWYGVATGELLKQDDPRMWLRTKILTAVVSTFSAEKEGVSPEEMFRWGLVAWNAWRQGLTPKKYIVDLSKDRPAIRA